MPKDPTADWEFLEKLADELDAAPRREALVNTDEGRLYVVISDKLLRELTAEFRVIARRMKRLDAKS